MNKDKEKATGDIMSLNIKDARALYVKHGKEFYADAQHLFDFFKKSKCNEGLANDNYLHALGLTELMFGNIQRSLKMLAGSGADSFIETLSNTFKTMLTRIRSNFGKAQIIVAGPNKPVGLSVLEDEYKDVLEVISAQPKKAEIGHFIVGDSLIVREEEPHKVLSESDPADIIRATVYLNNPVRAKTIEEHFDSIWNFLKTR